MTQPPIDIPTLTPRRPALQIYEGSHSLWFVKLVLAFVALLHTRHNVSFRACNLLLFCLHNIFIGLGLLPLRDSMPLSLTTVFKRLDLGDRFVIYPTCASCHRIFQINIPKHSMCPSCKIALLKPLSSSLFRRLTGKKAPPPAPAFSAPIQPLSSLLVDFLSRPEVEPELAGWRTRAWRQDEYKDISDGDVWRTLHGQDTCLFFDPSDCETPKTELRLGVTMAFDW